MKTHNLKQGTPEWLAYRKTMRNASDAPAMMGCCPYRTRSELLRQVYTGITPEVSSATQQLFDDGHRFEDLARPLAEEIIGEELDALVGSDGRYSASFDGISLMQDKVWEHKHLNDKLRAVLPATGVGGPEVGAALPLNNRVQMEQQCMVSGAEVALFTASQWDAEGNLVEARHCWYAPDAELRAAIIGGWAQFEADLASYVLPEAAAPAPVGRAPEALPALRIEVTGQVTASNLAEFKATALGAIRSVNRELRTDVDFANADKAVKWCADVEARLKAAKEHALSQTASIDALFKALDEIGSEARTVRLDLEKLVTRRKTEVKEAAVVTARKAWDGHIASLNAELAPMALRQATPDFNAAIKGLRTVASMQDALDTALANAKITADAQARDVRANIATFKANAEGLEFLFADLGQVVHKAPEDFNLLVQSRVKAHREAETERARKAAEAEAQRIAAAEQRARAEEAQRIAAAQAAQAAQAAAAQAQANAAQEAQASIGITTLRLGQAKFDGSTHGTVAVDAAAPQPAEPAATPAARLEAAAVIAGAQTAAAEPATITLSAIKEWLGMPNGLTREFVEGLGIKPTTDGRSILFTPTQRRQLKSAIITMLQNLQD